MITNVILTALLQWIWPIFIGLTAALVIAGFFLHQYRLILLVAAGVAFVFGAWTFHENAKSVAFRDGYDTAERFWKDKYDTLIRDYEAKAAQESERQRKAIEDAMRVANETIAQMETRHTEELREQQERDREADANPDRDSIGLNADSVRRVNRAGRSGNTDAAP